MTDEQIRDWRLERAGSVPRNGKSEREWTHAIAIEYARLVAENAKPVEDEAEACANAIGTAWNRNSFDEWKTQTAPEGFCEGVNIIRAYGNKRTATLQAELDRANGSLDWIREEIDSGQSSGKVYDFVRHTLAEPAKWLPEWKASSTRPASSLDTPRPAVVITDESFLEKLRRVNHERWIAWSGHDQADPLYAANEFGGEAGEVLNVVKKLVRASRGWKGSRTTVPKLADEIADCIICLDSLARMYDIDIASAVVAKFNATSDANGFPHKLEGLPS